jgi:hypothetical protein
LVLAKKTQRDKDWPMIRRLVEAHYENQDAPNDAMIYFWLRESRTPAMLAELLHRFPERIAAIASSRPWLESIGIKDIKHIEYLLRQEEDAQRLADEEYWKPLKAELEHLRLNRHRRK